MQKNKPRYTVIKNVFVSNVTTQSTLIHLLFYFVQLFIKKKKKNVSYYNSVLGSMKRESKFWKISHRYFKKSTEAKSTKFFSKKKEKKTNSLEMVFSTSLVFSIFWTNGNTINNAQMCFSKNWHLQCFHNSSFLKNFQYSLLSKCLFWYLYMRNDQISKFQKSYFF